MSKSENKCVRLHFFHLKPLHFLVVLQIFHFYTLFILHFLTLCVGICCIHCIRREIHNRNANPFVNCQFADVEVIFISVQYTNILSYSHTYVLFVTYACANIYICVCVCVCVSQIHIPKCMHFSLSGLSADLSTQWPR